MAPGTIRNGYLSSRKDDDELPIMTNSLCPSARTCLPGVLLEDFNPISARHDGPTLRRRLYASSIIAIRTAASIFLCFNLISSGLVDWFIIEIILGVIGFICMVWILHLIMHVHGRRRVMGKFMRQEEFDWFLLSMSLIHLGLVALSIFGETRIAGQALWVALFICIWVAAWVSTWPAEDFVDINV
jgi:hypothetical protein